MSASALTLIDYYPGGSQTGCPYYSGCYLINLWEITGQTQATVAANWGFDLASGSLTVNSVPVPVTLVPFTVGVTAIGESYIGG